MGFHRDSFEAVSPVNRPATCRHLAIPDLILAVIFMTMSCTMASFYRIIAAAAVAVPACAAIAGMLLLLPGPVAVGVMFCGLVMFLVGSKLHWFWTTAVGGVLMFAGVFAAALLGAIGPKP